MTTQEIMEQAQVFASACSLVGSRFDQGDGLANAEAMKLELREMVEAQAQKITEQQAEIAKWKIATSKNAELIRVQQVEIERLKESEIVMKAYYEQVFADGGARIGELKQQLSEAQANIEMPHALLRRASVSLGSFVSDEGWSQADMDTLDSVDAAITAHKARKEPTK